MHNNLRLFVYGTLRRACKTQAHQRLLQNAQFLGEGSVKGDLFKVSYYPALVESEGDSWVKGEIYLLQHPQDFIALDDYEEVSPIHPEPHEYRRKIIPVKLHTAGSQESQWLDCWSYLYQFDCSNLIKISSGDFLAAD